MDKQSENFNKELENIKKNQTELKNTITEVESTLEGINSRLDDTEKCFSKLEDGVMEFTQTEQKIFFFFNEDSLRAPETISSILAFAS